MTHIKEYHKSIGLELTSIKNRVRLLLEATTHWGSDGTYKEDILKEVLRRHLPLTTGVYSGFVKLDGACTRQIDIILVDETKNALFKSNDFCITTPSTVHAIIEVKTKIDNLTDLTKAVKNLSENISNIRILSQTHTTPTLSYDAILPWSALFAFDGFTNIEEKAAEVLEVFDTQAEGNFRKVIQCACLGPDVFIKYWPHSGCWEAYHLKGLAFSYFISNILLRDESPNRESSVWFPLVEGKDPYIIASKCFTRTNR